MSTWNIDQGKLDQAREIKERWAKARMSAPRLPRAVVKHPTPPFVSSPIGKPPPRATSTPMPPGPSSFPRQMFGTGRGLPRKASPQLSSRPHQVAKRSHQATRVVTLQSPISPVSPSLSTVSNHSGSGSTRWQVQGAPTAFKVSEKRSPVEKSVGNSAQRLSREDLYDSERSALLPGCKSGPPIVKVHFNQDSGKDITSRRSRSPHRKSDGPGLFAGLRKSLFKNEGTLKPRSRLSPLRSILTIQESTTFCPTSDSLSDQIAADRTRPRTAASSGSDESYSVNKARDPTLLNIDEGQKALTNYTPPNPTCKPFSSSCRLLSESFHGEDQMKTLVQLQSHVPVRTTQSRPSKQIEGVEQWHGESVTSRQVDPGDHSFQATPKGLTEAEHIPAGCVPPPIDQPEREVATDLDSSTKSSTREVVEIGKPMSTNIASLLKAIAKLPAPLVSSSDEDNTPSEQTKVMNDRYYTGPHSVQRLISGTRKARDHKYDRNDICINKSIETAEERLAAKIPLPGGSHGASIVSRAESTAGICTGAVRHEDQRPLNEPGCMGEGASLTIPTGKLFSMKSSSESERYLSPFDDPTGNSYSAMVRSKNLTAADLGVADGTPSTPAAATAAFVFETPQTSGAFRCSQTFNFSSRKPQPVTFSQNSAGHTSGFGSSQIAYEDVTVEGLPRRDSSVTLVDFTNNSISSQQKSSTGVSDMRGGQACPAGDQIKSVRQIRPEDLYISDDSLPDLLADTAAMQYPDGQAYQPRRKVSLSESPSLEILQTAGEVQMFFDDT